MQNRLEIKRWKANALPADWFKRANATQETDRVSVEKTVRDIIADVKKQGDTALLEYTERLDKTKLTKESLRVTAEEIKAAYAAVNEEQISALKFIKNRLESRETQIIQREMQQQLTTEQDGITVQTVLRSLESVGCYVPGGLAVYPSSVIMTAVPAKAAGVPRVVVCTPVKDRQPINPLVLVAADICGVDEVYKVGGAQAIAALAYGTNAVGKVCKIVGPGNKYVMMAKMLVSQDVAIDMPAGPSEVLVLADETADPKSIAADMISQAEHTPDSASGLITTSEKLANAVNNLLRNMVEVTDRKEIARESLETYGFIIVCDSSQELADLANAFAPEHLEIITANPQEIADKIVTAGLILLGPYAPVALSDYASGTNHVVPTGGFGASFSGLSVLGFTRRVNIVQSNKEGLQKAKLSIEVLTAVERLPNHYRAVEARFQK
ncbi:MAG: histidinol dehydrogenase [Candidatus Bathyarchaeota archaeon]|nr:histidinol dehydrogenase [Candidatus Bathyarchaeota archaeon]